MLTMTSQTCCQSVGTDLSMLDIDDFITEICQLKKEVKLLEEKLRTRGDELNTEIVVKVDTNPSDAQDTVCDSNHTLNQDESTDQTSTESLDSVCNAGEQQILNTKPLNMCSVTLSGTNGKLMEMRRQTTAEEEEHHTDEDENHDFIPSDASGDSCCDGETASTSKQRLTAQTLSCITEEHLEGHQSRHTEQKVLQEQRHHSQEHKKQFLCELCGKNFVSSFGLKTHMRTHTGEKSFHCSQCDKCFSIKGYLVTHQRIHTGEKPYVCPHCEKRFRHNSHLRKHLFLHTNERPNHCSECGKTFKSSASLKSHQRTHTGEKLYQCSRCDKRFREKLHLINHQRTHTGEKPFHCTVCGKSFTTHGTYSRHQRTHTTERPFKCSQCDKTFARSDVLKTHERVHTGEKPYHCSICGERFTYLKFLKAHEKKHAGIQTALESS